MTYEITLNQQFNSYEVKFDGKPADAIREALKALKFRWNPKKGVWYGFGDHDTITRACEGEKVKKQPKAAKPAAKKATKPAKKNKYGVKVGDFFSASWGYEQTNVDFFQVIELVGESSVRVREVHPERIAENPTCCMAADRTYKLDRTKILPPAPHSVFINDQERGDLKRLKSYQADGTRPQFYLSSFTDAYYISTDTVTEYESWYY